MLLFNPLIDVLIDSVLVTDVVLVAVITGVPLFVVGMTVTLFIVELSLAPLVLPTIAPLLRLLELLLLFDIVPIVSSSFLNLLFKFVGLLLSQ
jgi:hypothetical protein